MSRGLGQTTVALWNEIGSVLADHEGPMNSRQVAYQLVSSQVIENTEKEKQRIGRIIVQMRMAGAIPYSRIVDRTRAKHHRQGWDGVADIMEATADQYRRDLWRDQPVVPMIALEKRALEGVFSAIVDEFGVSLWTFGGYNSLSFDYEWSEAIKEITRTGRRVEIAYFGDFDPSGRKIEQTSRKRLRYEFKADFRWRRRGLNFQDFDDFDLARIPIKLGGPGKKGDPNAKLYRRKFGDYGAELDALPPEELERRIRDAIEEHIDWKRWWALQEREEAERDSLSQVAAAWEAARVAAHAVARHRARQARPGSRPARPGPWGRGGT